MADFVIIVILAILIGGALRYIIRAKKSGVKCIGCPSGSSCSGSCGSCNSCDSCNMCHGGKE